ncbi:MAG: ribosome recycling factor [Alphaproteobacteria bacterium]|jgi:ribosome recycling factor|nr:ribosome recycling factor [Alphaproteobacteria bacterium]
MTDAANIGDLQRRMNGAIEVLRKEFSGLRTGRASVSLLDPVVVEAYGAEMPLNQVATVSAPEPRLLSVQVWDQTQVKAVEKSIQNAGLGLNPIAEGQVLRIPIPELNEERRTEMTKVAAKYTEESRVAVRNVRRDGMDKFKKLEKEGELSEDEMHQKSDEVQKLTDQSIKQINELLAQKEAEIMQV